MFAVVFCIRLEAITVRILELYVRHVTLLRPLGEGGKMKVTTDMAEIELALAPFHQKLADLGTPYQNLRTLRCVENLTIPLNLFIQEMGGAKGVAPAQMNRTTPGCFAILIALFLHRRLLFLATDQFTAAENSWIGEMLPYSSTLNYLFSRAPADMKSPHQVHFWDMLMIIGLIKGGGFRWT